MKKINRNRKYKSNGFGFSFDYFQKTIRPIFLLVIAFNFNLLIGCLDLGTGRLMAQKNTESKNSLVQVNQSERDLPVVGKADVVVVGGGIAGITAALIAAEEGLNVILLESRNYFGQELTATYNCSFESWQPNKKADFSQKIFHEITKEGILSGNNFDPIQMRSFLLEKVNSNPKIDVYLFSLASEAIFNNGRVNGVVFSGRAGRQILLAKAVVDATEDARIARSLGAKLVRPMSGEKTARRFISIKRPEYLSVGPRPVESGLHIGGDSIMVHDKFLELAISSKVSIDIAGDISAIHAQTLEKSFALRDQLSDEGIELENFVPSPETWLDEVPVVECREKWSASEIASSQFFRSGPILPIGIEGLVLAGRTVDPHPKTGTLQGLLTLGELAGKTVIKISNEVKEFLPVSESAISLPVSLEKIQIKELLDGIEPGRKYPLLQLPAKDLPVLGEFDVLVVGGGTSGAVAAISAARHGANVAVIEILPNLGGISSNRVNAYYWGAPWKSLMRQELGEQIKLIKSIGTGPLEKVRFSGEDKKIALQNLAIAAGVKIYYQSLASGAVVEGNKVLGVVVENASGRHVLLSKVIIDASGHAGIAVAAGADFVKGRETDGFLNEIEHGPLRDPTNLEDISTSYLKFPSYAISMNIRESRRIIGDYTVTFEDVIQEKVFPDVISRWRSNYDTHLPSSANQTDISQDWVAILGLWRKPILGSIPYRSILPKGLENILVAAMSYSTDHDALIGGRMQADMEHLGEAAGVAAAMSSKKGLSLRDISLEELQKELVRIGVLRMQDVPHLGLVNGPSLELLHSQDLWREEREKRFPPSEEGKQESLMEAVSKLGMVGPVSKEQEIRAFGDTATRLPYNSQESLDAMVRLYLAGEEAIPVLRTVLETKDSQLKTEGTKSFNISAYEEAAVLLGMLGDRTAIPALLGFLKERNTRQFEYKLEQASSRPSLPLYWISTVLLGRFGEKAAVPDLLKILSSPPYPEEFHNFRRTAYGDDMFVDTESCPPSLASFILVALGRIGDPKATEEIKPFLKVSNPTHIKEENTDFEIAWGVKTNAAWALAQMGDYSGVPMLIELLNSDQALLRNYAQQLLETITGEKLGMDSKAWEKWLRSSI